MSEKENLQEENVKIKEEKTEEIKEETCHCQSSHDDCSCCDHDGCDFEDFSFEPIHKSSSCANIFSIVSKVIAVLYLILGSYGYVMSIVEYNEMYGEMPTLVDVVMGYFSSLLLVAFAFWAIGEVINLLNRLKEAIMY